jgi:hypothetical protein
MGGAAGGDGGEWGGVKGEQLGSVSR